MKGEKEARRERERDRETEMHNAIKSQLFEWIANPSARPSQSLSSQPGEDSVLLSPADLEN